MRYRRLPIEIESPEQMGYETLKHNLTESSCSDAELGSLAEGLERLLLAYGDHRGLPRLRALIAAQGEGVKADDVLVTPGAAAALFIVATALLEKGDEMLVVRPNYATNVETPEAIGCKVGYLDLRFEDGWRLDPAEVERRLTPRTKLVSLTTPHNPTGTVIPPADLKRIVSAVERAGARLLVDETYRDMTFGAPAPFAASMSPRVIGVSSLSKTYGLPGLRAGWIACRDAALMETFLAAKEQIVLCGSGLDEEVAARALERRAARLPGIKGEIAARFAAVKDWMEEETRLEWVEPRGGVVCFPRLKDPSVAEAFYRALNAAGTFVGPGHWFGMDRRYFRLGYGWPKSEELAAGLASIVAALDAATLTAV